MLLFALACIQCSSYIKTVVLLLVMRVLLSRGSVVLVQSCYKRWWCYYISSTRIFPWVPFLLV